MSVPESLAGLPLTDSSVLLSEGSRMDPQTNRGFWPVRPSDG